MFRLVSLRELPKLFGRSYTKACGAREVQWKDQRWLDLWASWAERTIFRDSRSLNGPQLFKAKPLKYSI